MMVASGIRMSQAGRRQPGLAGKHNSSNNLREWGWLCRVREEREMWVEFVVFFLLVSCLAKFIAEKLAFFTNHG